MTFIIACLTIAALFLAMATLAAVRFPVWSPALTFAAVMAFLAASAAIGG